MRIVYMATAEIAVVPLEKLSELAGDLLVVSQPDRPSGRKRVLSPSPIKERALAMGHEVLTPEKVGDAETVAAIQAFNPDLVVVFAYGQFIPERICSIPDLGTINIHPSLLPKYRGAAPIQWAIANGDAISGVSIITVAQKMDAGDILLQREEAIAPDDTAASYSEKMSRLGGELIVEAVNGLVAGTIQARPQDEAQVVEVRKLEKSDGRIEWKRSAQELHNRIRGFNPWPGSFCEVHEGESLKIWRSSVEAGKGEPGTVLSVDGDGPLIATGEGALRLLAVQPQGKKPMAGDAFLRGHGLKVGDRIS